MLPASNKKSHGYRLNSLPGAGVQSRQLGTAPLLTRVSGLFSTGEPILLGTHQAPADVYTLAHLASGAVLGFGRAPWWSIFAVAVGWGAVGYVAQKLWPAPVAAASLQNMVGDAAAMTLGWALAKTWVEHRLDVQGAATQEEVIVTPAAEEASL